MRAAGRYAQGFYTYAVAVADLSADGRPDPVVAVDGGVSVVLNAA